MFTRHFSLCAPSSRPSLPCSWIVHRCLSSWKQRACEGDPAFLRHDDMMTFPSHSVKLICIFPHQEAPLLPSLQPRIWPHCLRALSFEVRVSVTGAALKSRVLLSVHPVRLPAWQCVCTASEQALMPGSQLVPSAPPQDQAPDCNPHKQGGWFPKFMLMESCSI